MIYYFSGNGNSRWVAEEIASATNDMVENIAEYIKGHVISQVPDTEDTVGIVFPIHSWYAPRPVIDFLTDLEIPPGAYCYIVCTCGDDVGKGMQRLAKHFDFDAVWSVVMPETYIPMFDLDTEEGAKAKIEQARKRIDIIVEDIENKRHVWDVKEGGFAWFKTYIINPLFVNLIIRSKGFHIEGNCTSCGVCRDICPMGNIKITHGHPVWSNKCIHCMGCINSCPQHIIQYRKATRKRGRYRLKKYL
jgi:ferredoxin